MSNILNIEIWEIFDISNGNFGQIVINIPNFFFMIFDENGVFYLLVEFESDRMSPRESAKNGQIGAHGLNYNFFFQFSGHIQNVR